MNISKRVVALENQTGDRGFASVHRIVVESGQTQEQAINAYGRDKIGPKDLTIVRTFITPRFDVEGKMIHPKEWPENREAGQ